MESIVRCIDGCLCLPLAHVRHLRNDIARGWIEHFKGLVAGRTDPDSVYKTFVQQQIRRRVVPEKAFSRHDTRCQSLRYVQEHG